MLRTLISLALFGAYCSAAPAPASGSSSQKVNLFMPDLQVKQDDGYMCLAMKMAPDQSVFITGFEPKADMTISHHILLYGCEEAGDESGKPFSCTQMDHASADAKPTCTKGSAVIYAWAMGAPSFQLPQDVAFKVGKDTKMRTLVLQMHFKFNGTYKGGSGLSMTVQQQPTPKVAGIYLMATGGVIPAQSRAYLETACEYSLPTPLSPFAYRAHTHTLGVVVSGYRVRDDEWTEIGRKNPQLPQMFYPLTVPGIDVQAGDVLAARCTMQNTGDSDILIGATKNDEMCNFYVMYSVPNTPESEEALKDADGCFSDGKPYTRTELRRDFGITTGFPLDSVKVPASDVQLAKTMGDHMQMGMGGMKMPMSMPMPAKMETTEVEEEPSDEENEFGYRAFLNRYADSDDADADDADEDDESTNEINLLRKRYYNELAAAAAADDSSDESD